MPELPEIETIVVELRKKISGFIFSSIIIHHEAVLKTPRALFEKTLPGKTIHQISRRGKYLGLGLGQDVILWFHLGMTGQLLIKSGPGFPDPHEHFTARFENRSEALIFRDIRKFGGIFLTGKEPETFPKGLRTLGPEPWDLKPEAFVRLLKQRKAKIKSLLLNQKILAGLGNIYADESLYRAGIDPRLRPARLKSERLAQLHERVSEVLKEAICAGGSSIDDYRRTDGGRGSFQKFHRVYGHEGDKCLSCQTVIRRTVISGRSSFFCPKCQT